MITGAAPFCDPAPYSAERFASLSQSHETCRASSAARRERARPRLVDAARDGAGHHVGGQRAKLATSRMIGSRQRPSRSPPRTRYRRRAGCGPAERARDAVLRHDGEPPGLRLGQRASVATTTSVVFSPGWPLVRKVSACGRHLRRLAKPAEFGVALERRRPEMRAVADHRRCPRH